MKKVLPILIAIALGVPALSACDKVDFNRWAYNKEDMSSFMNMEAELHRNENIAEISISSEVPLIKTKVTVNDVKVFDFQQALKQARDQKKGYLSYEIINNNSLTIKNINSDETKKNLTITVDNDENIEYAMIINKDVIAQNNYVICKANEQSFEFGSELQTTFEEQYLSEDVDWKDGVEFLWDIACNVAMICIGTTAGPAVIASGIIGIVNTTFGALFSETGPTNAEIMNKLEVMDEKIDKISEKINENYKQLSDGITRATAKIDESLLNLYMQNITSFVTDFTKPIDDYKRDLGDYYDQSYKKYVSKEERVEMYFSKDSEGNYTYIPTLKENPASQEQISFTIERFDNSLEFLKKNGNIVSKGFVDELYKDIEEALKTVSLPSGLDKDTVRDCAMAHIIEEFNKDYYANNHQKALDLKNLSINYCKRISGRLGATSVLHDYVSRVKHMYNFGKEYKPKLIGLLSNYLYDVDRNIALTAEACAYAETNNTEVSDEYRYAREAIKNAYESIKDIPDGYSLVTETNVDGQFYQAKFDTTYDNPGNDAKLKANFKLKKMRSPNVNDYEVVDASKINNVSIDEHTRINLRRKLLMELGEVKNTSYVEYLKDAGGISVQAYLSYTGLLNNGWISDDGLRIATDLTSRGLTDKDKNLELHYSAQGNRYSALFDEKWSGKYKSCLDKDCWNGNIIETRFIDGKTGTEMANTKVAAYASYHESHWYWANDEIWAFVDNPAGNYMFILNKTI